MHTQHAVRLITISREFGAGGSDLALDLHERLGWPVLDRDLTQRVAKRLCLDSHTVETLDEHPPSLLRRIASALAVPQPEYHSFPPLEDTASADVIAVTSRAVIEEMAESPPLIVVGHGAQCIFFGRRDALHVRVVAPIPTRLDRIITRLGAPANSARELLRRADEDRQFYVHRYYQRDVRDDMLYDIRMNTGGLKIPECGAMIVSVVQARQ
jgi:hypothetical protein